MKVLIWGTGKKYNMLKAAISEFALTGDIDIEAFINKEGCGDINGICIIGSSDIYKMQFDKILVCADGEMADSILDEAEKIGIPNDIILNIDDYINQYGKKSKHRLEMVEKQCCVLKKILNSTDEEINDISWIKDRICEFGVYPFVRNEDSKIVWTYWGIMQIIDEFAEYCAYLSKFKINKAIEIGVFKGRSSYFMCAVLSRNNPKLEYLCVDIYDNLDSFEEYKKVLPALNKRIPTTSDNYIYDEFDYVFIDADHSYDGSIADYKNIGCKSRVLTAFHDIYGHEYDELNGGTVRMWKEVVADTPNDDHRIFSVYPEKWMGIGVVEWKR